MHNIPISCGDYGRCIYQHKKWPDFIWDKSHITALLLENRYQQGRLYGFMDSVGFQLQEEALLKIFTLDVIKTSEIEGEHFEKEEVRSSIARKMGFENQVRRKFGSQVEGIVDVMLDATQQYDQTLSKDRLCDWHQRLFPEGKNGLYEIKSGDYREDTDGPMQIVSGAMGREKIS